MSTARPSGEQWSTSCFEGDHDERPLLVRELIVALPGVRRISARAPTLGFTSHFGVGSMTIEGNFVATRTKDREGGLDFRVVTAGASRRHGDQHWHNITIVLEATEIARSANGDDAFNELNAEGSRFMPREED